MLHYGDIVLLVSIKRILWGEKDSLEVAAEIAFFAPNTNIIRALMPFIAIPVYIIQPIWVVLGDYLQYYIPPEGDGMVWNGLWVGNLLGN